MRRSISSGQTDYGITYSHVAQKRVLVIFFKNHYLSKGYAIAKAVLHQLSLASESFSKRLTSIKAKYCDTDATNVQSSQPLL